MNAESEPRFFEVDDDTYLRDLLGPVPDEMTVNEYLNDLDANDGVFECFGLRANLGKVMQFLEVCAAVKPLDQEPIDEDGIGLEQSYATIHVDLEAPNALTVEQRKALQVADHFADEVYITMLPRSGVSGAIRYTFLVYDVWEALDSGEMQD